MKPVVSLNVLLAGWVLLAACNPVRPLPVGEEMPAASYTFRTDETGTSHRLAEDAEIQGSLQYEGLAALGAERGTDLGTDEALRCATLAITNGEAQITDCEGAVTAMPLSPMLADTWADLSARFGSFVYETPSERLTFAGQGTQAGAMWQRALLAWARVTRAELASGQVSATARTALSWHLGPVPDLPDVCAHLTVLDYGYAYGEQRGCESGDLFAASEDWLDEAELEQFDRWLYAYAPFYLDDNYLNGAGADQLPEDEAAALRAWTEELWMRLTGLPVVPANSSTETGAGEAALTPAGTACNDPAADNATADAAYRNDEHGFCLRLPPNYAIVETAPGNFSLVAGGDIMDHVSPRVSIEVSAAGDRTLADIADQMIADYTLPGSGITAEPTTVAGVDAMLLDNLPGQGLNRRIVLVRDGKVFSLMLMPLSPEAEPFYQSVLTSLRFLD